MELLWNFSGMLWNFWKLAENGGCLHISRTIFHSLGTGYHLRRMCGLHWCFPGFCIPCLTWNIFWKLLWNLLWNVYPIPSLSVEISNKVINPVSVLDSWNINSRTTVTGMHIEVTQVFHGLIVGENFTTSYAKTVVFL